MMRRVVIYGLPVFLMLAGCVSVKNTPPAAEPAPVTAPAPPAPTPQNPPVPASAAQTAEPTAPSAAPPPVTAPATPSPAPARKSQAKPKNVAKTQVTPAPAAPQKSAAQQTPTAPSAPATAAAPSRPAAPTLDLAALEQRLRDTHAIGVFTKLSLKNQVDDLLDRFRQFHRRQTPPTLDQLRQQYDLLLLKVLSLLQDGDPSLAQAISSSRSAIWNVLTDPQKFQQI